MMADEDLLEEGNDAPKVDPCKVHLKGLKPSVAENAVRTYIQSTSDNAKVKDVQLGYDGNALVTFFEPQDFEHLDRTIRDKGLNGCNLTLERVPYCRCISVSGLSSKTTEDTIKFYFENPRKDCGEEACKIELDHDLGRARLYFKDHSVLDKLLDKHHILDGAVLKVEPHYQFLERENCATAIDVDPDVMAYIKDKFEKELQSVLDENAIELYWTPKETKAVVCEKKTTFDSNENSGKINKVKMLLEFLEEFEKKVIIVGDMLWEEVAEDLNKRIDDKILKDIDLSLDPESFSIKLISKKENIINVAKQIEIFIEEVNEERRIQNSIECHVEKDISSEEIALIKNSNFIDHLHGSYKYISIDTDDEKGTAIIKSPKNKLQEITCEVLRFLRKIDKNTVKLSERILEVLRSPKGKEYVCNAFEEANIIAVLTIHVERKDKNEGLIFAINSDHCAQGIKLIQSLTKEKAIHLEPESMQVIKKQKYKELVVQQKEMFVLDISLETQSSTLWISGNEDDVIKCHADITEYIEKYTIFNDYLDVPSGELKFLSKVWNKKLKKIEQDLRESFLKMELNHTDMKIKLSGNRNGIKVGKEKLKALIEKVCYEKVIIERPGMAKFFKSGQGAKEIKIIESENKCTVQFEETSGLMPSSPMEDSVHNIEPICSYATPEGKKLIVCKDDLTKHHADVIVNAANNDLQHSGGLAGAIVRAGGQQIQDECDRYTRQNGQLSTGQVLETGPGKLPCKRIIHAVGPRWGRGAGPRRGDGQISIQEEQLYSAIQNCLSAAKDYNSLAIPAVSSGIFGFPRDLCASTLIQSVMDFFRHNPECKLSEVRFTNHDDPTVKAFETEMQKRFAGNIACAAVPSLERKASPEPYQDTTNIANPDDGRLLTPEGISISVKVGDIAQENADVLVNTVGDQLNLQNNACAKSFSKVAGPELQRYCNAIAPVQVGNIGVTQPGKLKCKYVFHAVCCDWDNGNGKQALSKILGMCLNEADKRGARSISIPAIGTGVLGFPRNVVAKLSFDEVIMFSRTQPNSNLKEVRFVVYSLDKPTVNSFQKEFDQRRLSSRHQNLGSNSKRKGVSSAVSSSRQSTNPPATARGKKPKMFEIKVGKISVQIRMGDIAHKQTDAKANLTVSSLPSDSKSKLSRSLGDHLKEAEVQGLESVSFPALKTENPGLSSKEYAKVVLSVAKKFSKSHPKSIQLIRIIVFEESMVDDFISAMKKYSAPGNEGNLWEKIKKGFTRIRSKKDKGKRQHDDVGAEMSLHVYSGNPSNLKGAIKAINDTVNEKSSTQKIEKETISCIETAQMKEIQSLQQQFDCKITVEQTKCLITVEGLSEDVLKATTVIHDILHKIMEEKHELAKAESIAKDVQWQYDTGDDFTPYTIKVNAKIETAFRNKEETATVVENGEELIIDFNNMVEISSADGVSKHTIVKRKDLNLVSLPQNWDPQPKSSSGVEKAIHLVNLDPTSQEYNQVRDLFYKSSSKHNILRIRRVQNPEQYKIYSIRKQKMDDKEGSNEKQLFHGTAAESCDSINQNGFNRSYCGKNATVFGQGVYFAVNAEYSARVIYSPADLSGTRYMYLARVLTGEYTKGERYMIVPPPKNFSKPNDRYDTVVDDPMKPSIFVVFYDGQAYPEYLIEFN